MSKTNCNDVSGEYYYFNYCIMMINKKKPSCHTYKHQAKDH